MTPELKRTLKNQSRALQKKPATARKLPVQAGDQACEGLFGNLTTGMQRSNLKGRSSGERVHFNVLSTGWSLRNPGFDGVLAALRQYREYVQDKVKPREAFVDKSWMFA